MTSSSDIAEKVRAALGREIKRDPTTIELHHALRDDLGLNSLDAIELMFTVEREFDLEIPDADLQGLRTVGDIVTYLASRIGGPAASGDATSSAARPAGRQSASPAAAPAPARSASPAARTPARDVSPAPPRKPTPTASGPRKATPLAAAPRKPASAATAPRPATPRPAASRKPATAAPRKTAAAARSGKAAGKPAKRPRR